MYGHIDSYITFTIKIDKFYRKISNTFILCYNSYINY